MFLCIQELTCHVAMNLASCVVVESLCITFAHGSHFVSCDFFIYHLNWIPVTSTMASGRS